MRGAWRKIPPTVRLMLYALLPAKEREAAAAPRRAEALTADEGVSEVPVRLCEPSELRGGVDRLLDERGELRVVFRDCLGISAPFLLFRLKRQGYSRCVVKVIRQGLYVEAKR